MMDALKDYFIYRKKEEAWYKRKWIHGIELNLFARAVEKSSKLPVLKTSNNAFAVRTWIGFLSPMFSIELIHNN